MDSEGRIGWGVLGAAGVDAAGSFCPKGGKERSTCRLGSRSLERAAAAVEALVKAELRPRTKSCWRIGG